MKWSNNFHISLQIRTSASGPTDKRQKVHVSAREIDFRFVLTGMKHAKTLHIIPLFALTLTWSGLTSAAENPHAPEKKPGYDKSKDVGLAPPEGADIPFDGTMASVKKNWRMWPKADMPITWSLVDSPDGTEKVLMTNGGKKWGTHDLVTRKTYTDFEGHVEFIMLGKRGDEKVEGYSNSGVYLQNRYEIQIESPKGKNVDDPYNWKIGPHGIAAFCMDRVPDANAWRPNGEWHAFHFVFKAARYEDDKLVEDARATVWWNGIKVHDNAVIRKANGGEKVGPSPQGLKLQEHGQDVRFRNIWIVDKSK